MPQPVVTDAAQIILRRAREAAAYPYVMRWRPLLLTTLLTFIMAFKAFGLYEAEFSALVPVTVMVGLSWCAVAAVRLGVSPLSAALVLSFADLPLIGVWAMTESSPGESMSAVLAVLIVGAWLYGPMVTIGLAIGSIGTIMAVWFGRGPWTDQTLPDVVWIVIVGGALSIAIAHAIEKTIVSSVQQLHHTRSEAEALFDMRTRLAADVSHELRTPLTSINGFIDTLLREDITVDSELARELLEQARSGGDRLEQLIVNLLEVEQATVGSLRLEIQPQRLGAMLASAVGMMRPTNRIIEVRYDRTVDDNSTVHVDARRFVQIIKDLISNGIEHGSGTVTIRCARRMDELIIDVTDEGAGVPDEHAEHIFEPFISFGEHVGSAGIGLSMARSLAVAHGGRLEYHPRIGDSSHIFRLRLPCWSAR